MEFGRGVFAQYLRYALVPIFVTIPILMFSVAAIAKPVTGVVYGDLGLTQSTPYSADYLGEQKPLLVFEKGFDDGNYLYGRYRGQMDLTGGHDLLIFPDGEFALTWWCDVCGAPETIALGTWSRSGNELSFKITTKSKKVDQKPLKDMAFFVIAGERKVVQSILVMEPLQKDVPYGGFVVRVEQYMDWSRDLQKAKMRVDEDTRPLYLRALMFVESSPLGAGMGLVMVICGVLGLFWAFIPFRNVRRAVAVLMSFGVAYLIYWTPVWVGADSNEFGAWALLALVMWGVPGVGTSLVISELIAYLWRRTRGHEKG